MIWYKQITIKNEKSQKWRLSQNVESLRRSRRHDVEHFEEAGSDGGACVENDFQRIVVFPGSG